MHTFTQHIHIYTHAHAQSHIYVAILLYIPTQADIYVLLSIALFQSTAYLKLVTILLKILHVTTWSYGYPNHVTDYSNYLSSNQTTG